MRVLATALLAVCACAAFATSASAAGPTVRELNLTLPDGGGASAAAATQRPGRFDLVGVRWRGAGDVTIRVLRHGRWSPWLDVERGDPMWVDGSDAIRVRRAPGVRDVKLGFVRITNRVHPKPRARTSQQTAMPPMVTRAEWDPGNQCKPRNAPTYGAVRMAFVHHTVSVNEYLPEDSASMVLAICKYHRDDNGWNDLGYNFLVDKYGRLFEGRAGGVDKPVVGAQAEGWNSQSTSVSNIGTYSDVPQSEAAIDAMAQLLAWKLTLHGVPVTGTVNLVSGGGSENRYPSGTTVAFQRISGHRDGGKTACPGDALYAQLPTIRDRAYVRAPFPVAPAPLEAQPGEITATPVSTALVYPEPLQMSGHLSGAGRVSLQVKGATTWTTVGRASPGAEGDWQISARLAAGRSVRAVQVLPSGKVGAVSDTFTVSVAPLLTAKAAKRVKAAGTGPLVRGTISPAKAKLTLTVSLQGKDGTLRYVRTLAVTAKRGAYAARVRLRTPGLYRLRVRFAGDGATKPSYAPDAWVRSVRGSTTPPSSSSGGLEARAAR